MEHEMQHLYQQLHIAGDAGYLDHLQFLPSGSIRSITENSVFPLRDVDVIIECCPKCRWTLYCICLPNGNMGTAVKWKNSNAEG